MAGEGYRLPPLGVACLRCCCGGHGGRGDHRRCRCRSLSGQGIYAPPPRNLGTATTVFKRVRVKAASTGDQAQGSGNHKVFVENKSERCASISAGQRKECSISPQYCPPTCILLRARPSSAGILGRVPALPSEGAESPGFCTCCTGNARHTQSWPLPCSCRAPEIDTPKT